MRGAQLARGINRSPRDPCPRSVIPTAVPTRTPHTRPHEQRPTDPPRAATHSAKLTSPSDGRLAPRPALLRCGRGDAGGAVERVHVVEAVGAVAAAEDNEPPARVHHRCGMVGALRRRLAEGANL